jgi:hypothetical protein
MTGTQLKMRSFHLHAALILTACNLKLIIVMWLHVHAFKNLNVLRDVGHRLRALTREGMIHTESDKGIHSTSEISIPSKGNCGAAQISHRERHGHKPRKKQQAIENKKETPAHFQHRIYCHANHKNLYA